MYDVASRTIITRSTTGPDIGPSTYVICNVRCQKESCVPFLSTTKIGPSFVQKIETDALYDIRDSGKSILGGSCLRNKSARFTYQSDNGPGPADYNAKPIRCTKKNLIFDPTKPKLYACAVPYSMSVVAPSIPTRVDEDGYEIDKDGNIIKIPRQEPNPIPINIKSQFCSGKGFNWACSGTKRFNPNKYETSGPGPAAYTLEVSKSRQEEEAERFREMARKATCLPRYLELQGIRALRENKPGPGAYNTGKLGCRRKKPKKVPPFIVGSERFSSFSSVTPAPNVHQPCYCSKKGLRESCAPFGVQGSRFGREKDVCTPGPGSYDMKSPLQEKIEKKKNPHALCDPPFNSTRNRDINFVLKDSLFMPSSADYPEDKEDQEENKTPISSSVFMNNVCRFFSPSDKKDCIGPAKYNEVKSFQINRDRKSFNVAEVPFNASLERKSSPKAKFGVPCPTTYENKGEELGCKGRHFAVSPRFPCPQDTPGPGAYNIHPRVTTSTYNAFDTHNLRLKENVLHQKLRQAPRDTRKRWVKTLRKKKLLKWFDIELNFEERMMMLVQEVFDKPV